jgi:N-acetylglucosamine-6-phosphate deacetylase
MAGEKDAIRAIDAGARRCTHIFNGMPPLHQRECSLTTVALSDNRVSVELIADGRHIHPMMVDLVGRLKPKDKVIGISDAVQPTGVNLDDTGTYHLGEREILIRDGLATTGTGVIAGTTMTLEMAWHHLRSYARMPSTIAASCFTANPAHDLGLITRGELKPASRRHLLFRLRDEQDRHDRHKRAHLPLLRAFSRGDPGGVAMSSVLPYRILDSGLCRKLEQAGPSRWCVRAERLLAAFAQGFR